MKTKNNSQQPLGQKLADLRTRQNMTIDELADKTGLKATHLKAIEEGKDFLPVADILKISRVLTIDPDLLFQSEKEKKRNEQRKKDFSLREESYQYDVLAPGPKESHLRTFRVTIPPNSEHPKVKYQHEGEEVIYMLQGEMEIRVGSKTHMLKKGETLHFDSSKRHSLKNPGTKKAVFIDVIYTP